MRVTMAWRWRKLNSVRAPFNFGRARVRRMWLNFCMVFAYIIIIVVIVIIIWWSVRDRWRTYLLNYLLLNFHTSCEMAGWWVVIRCMCRDAVWCQCYVANRMWYNACAVENTPIYGSRHCPFRSVTLASQSKSMLCLRITCVVQARRSST